MWRVASIVALPLPRGPVPFPPFASCPVRSPFPPNPTEAGFRAATGQWLGSDRDAPVRDRRKGPGQGQTTDQMRRETGHTSESALCDSLNSVRCFWEKTWFLDVNWISIGSQLAANRYRMYIPRDTSQIALEAKL